MTFCKSVVRFTKQTSSQNISLKGEIQTKLQKNPLTAYLYTSFSFYKHILGGFTLEQILICQALKMKPFTSGDLEIPILQIWLQLSLPGDSNEREWELKLFGKPRSRLKHIW